MSYGRELTRIAKTKLKRLIGQVSRPDDIKSESYLTLHKVSKIVNLTNENEPLVSKTSGSFQQHERGRDPAW